MHELFVTAVHMQVWMALSEKGIPFDTVLIDLFSKPEWYTEVASNGKTPAVRLDGQNVCESFDIMLVRLAPPAPTPQLLHMHVCSMESALLFQRWVLLRKSERVGTKKQALVVCFCHLPVSSL